MREIGGYFELENFKGKEFYQDKLRFNSARKCFSFLMKVKGYNKVYIPDFLCSSIIEECNKEKIVYEIYPISKEFLVPDDFNINQNSALYVVNYYGQLKIDYIKSLKEKFPNIILDNTQAFFQEIEGIDTIYNCRKYFGVADGAYLAIMSKENFIEQYDELEQDYSGTRCGFILGRYEKTASEFYKEACDNNAFFTNESIKKMSKLTSNILKAIDYKAVQMKRYQNFATLHSRLNDSNLLRNLNIPVGAYMYPYFVENSVELRKYLIGKKVYVPILWPEVLLDKNAGCLAREYAEHIVPLPCDQRYETEDMEYICNLIEEFLKDE